MALGFIKKVFSFGKRDEPKPEGPAPAPAAADTLPFAAPEVPVASPAEAVTPVQPAVAADPVPRAAEPVAEAPIPPVAVAETPSPVAEKAEPASEAVAVEPLPAVAEAHALPAEEPAKESTNDRSYAADPGSVGLPAAEIPAPIRQPSPVDPDPLIAEIAPEPTPVPPVATAAPATPPAGRVTVARSVEAKAAPTQAAPAAEPRQSWLQRLRGGLSRSSRELTSSIAGVFTKKKLDEETLEELEDVLVRADLGMETAIRITGALAQGRHGRNVSDDEVRTIMAQEIEKVLTPVAGALELDLAHKPHVILVVGVNGTGKTTTIGKLAAKLVAGGLKVTLAAGDTFRAAAIEQLKIWGERTGSPVVASKLGADAAGLAHDAYTTARAAGSDVLMIDTAGRLQNKAELMAELEKIVRVLGKLDPDAPHTVLQTVDATTGQNALNQVEIFRNVAGVNGLVMTKLDGTARGGILVAIAAKHRLPVYFIGVGEQVDDLEPFSARDFARAIAGVA
jgi:fused signal recognition particle receptor